MSDENELEKAGPNPWHPITDPIALKHLGKLCEEASELAGACARCIIQGVDESEPVTHVTNRHKLEDEMADVLANMLLVENHFQLDSARINRRTQIKMNFLKRWHSQA